MLAAAAVLASMSMASTFGEQSNTLLDQARIDRKAAAVLRERGDVDSVRAAVELERRAAEVERRAESLRSLGSNPAPAGTTPDASGAAQGRPASKISSTDASAPPRPDFRSADPAVLRRYSEALSFEQRERSRAYSSQVQELLKLNELEAARRRALESLAIDPGNVQAHLGLGDVLKQSGDIEAARRHYGLASTIDPMVLEAAIAAERALDLSRSRAGVATSAAEALFSRSAGLEKRRNASSGSNARLVIFRPSGHAGSSVSNRVILDGRQIGELNNGGSLEVSVAPGSHELANVRMYRGAWQGECRQAFEFKSGEIYTLEVQLVQLASIQASSPAESACSFAPRKNDG